ncbi:hypothetical protein VTO58DRAFT_107456 [Aureobasidium pullulans]|nr:hypothetical protein JADG_010865 [Aureobasidium pullulans]KAG2171129.1 hypothetical protein JADG_010868 [Aureobasidium pullulans]
MAHLFPPDQPGRRSGGGIFTFLGAHNRSPPISSIPRSTSVQQRHRVQDILPNSIRKYVQSNDRLVAHDQKHAPIRKKLRQKPDDGSTADPAYILETGTAF